MAPSKKALQSARMHYTLSMDVTQEQVIALLREANLFRKLTDEQLAELAAQFELVHFNSKDLIYKQGATSESFYLIMQGKVQLTVPGKKVERQLATLVRGDYFGEDLTSYNRKRTATARASGDVTLLKLASQKFFALPKKYKEFAPNLNIAITSRRLNRQHQLRFLNKDEVVYVMLHKHPIFLWVRMLPWAILLLIGLLFSFTFLLGIKPIAQYVIIFSIAYSLLLLGVIAWNGVDWSNDYFIVTNQRVVWLEKIILIYESRQETPLSSILSVNVETSFWGRTFNYGDVIVRTYTGTIPLHHIGRPFQVASMVEEYWARSKVVSMREEAAAMEQAIRRKLGLLPEEVKPPAKAEPPKIKKTNQPGFLTSLFANFFQVRFEEKGTVTYRKHWYVLLQAIGLPTVLFIGCFVLLGARLGGYFKYISLTAFALVVFFFMICIFGWWFYNYWDWRNDIYQVTQDQILDIERKPLGRENKRSAPLENILSIEYERLGIVGLLLNYGTVFINIGASKFQFNDVFDPSQVQQDIYRRMAQRVNSKKQVETARDRERFSEWIATYHRSSDSFRQEQPPAPPENNP
jgi:hypothetical protein